MSLYLKYRPSDFESIVWQKQVKDILKAEIENNKISHSYIFFWPRWTWKTSTARIFAKAINCLAEKNKPCNECENCKLINEWKTLDFVEIDAASNTQVDKIREEIIDKAIYPPTVLKKKVYIIDEVHMLSKSAFNALLKIMEEPPEYLVFILATTEIHKVPETIISRCEVFNFTRIPLDQIVERLKFICEKENINYTDDGLLLIAKISDGWLRDAIKYLEQVSIIWEVNQENVSKFLWIAPERQIVDFIEKVKTKNLDEIYTEIEKLQNNWIDLSNFVKDVLFYLNQNLQNNLAENLKLVDIFDEIYQNIKNFPSAELAYKFVLWKKVLWINFEDNFTNTWWSLSNSDVNVKEKTSEKIEKPSEDKEKKSQNVEKTSKKSNEKIDKKISKEELLKNISSPIIKWIIKNFWEVELVDWKIVITIISKSNYEILKKPDKLQQLEDVINKTWGNIPVEVVYMSKEEFFSKKLLA